MRPIWLVVYTKIKGCRTTELKTLKRSKDVNAFIDENQIYGYVIRQAEKNSFVRFFRNFLLHKKEN